MADGQSGANSLPTSIVVSLPAAPPPPPLPVAASPARPNNSLLSRKPGILPANLEEMKVSESNPHILTFEIKVKDSGFKTRPIKVGLYLEFRFMFNSLLRRLPS